jgi:hypothetical protein
LFATGDMFASTMLAKLKVAKLSICILDFVKAG